MSGKKNSLKWLEYVIYSCIFIVLLSVIISRIYRSPVSVSKEDLGPVTDAKIIDKSIVLGNVPVDTVVNMKYRIVNTGQDILKVLNVNPDCSCTDFKISAVTVLPQDTTDIILIYDTKDRIGENKINAIVKLNTQRRMYKITAYINVVERNQNKTDNVK